MKNMIRIFILISVLATALTGFSQESKPTNSFNINGKVESPKIITMADLKKLKMYNLGDIVITNHRGEVKGTAKELTGVLLTQVLEQVEFDAETPKVLSEYYFSCIASDGYRVVYSWNELFNTVVGNSVYIILSKEHKSIDDSEENILMISTQDAKTGRRYLKNLETIQVGRIR